MPGLTLAGGRVWDGLDDATAAGEVYVDGGLIAAAAGEGARVIDVSGCTVLPGLIEGHGHLCFNAQPDWRAVYDGDSPTRMLLRMQGHAASALRAGITTFRDLGAPTPLAIELREAIRGGLVVGPDLVVAGAPVTTTGGHCWFMRGEADGELGVRVAVRERVKAGVDWIKVMASGGNMTPGSNIFAAQYSVAELRAGIDEAHRLDRRVAAHAHGVAGIQMAVEAGVDVLEHCSFQTPAGSVKDASVVAEIARRGILVSPTISGRLLEQQDTERFQLRADLVRALRTMQAMTGQSGVEVLRLATSTSARLLRLPDRGTIAVGQRADLLVVEGDPTCDLEALGRVRAVVAASGSCDGSSHRRSQSLSPLRRGEGLDDHQEPALTTFQEFTDPRLVALYDALDPSRVDTAFYLGLAAELSASSVIDIGCGTGAITCELARQGYRMTGVDPSLPMLEIARHRPGGDLVEWIEGYASALDGPPADLAIMTAHVAQVISDEDVWRRTLAATHEALRPGGRLAFESRNPGAQQWLAWTPQTSRQRLNKTAFGPVDLWWQLLDVRGDMVRYEIHYRFTSNGEEVISTNELRFRTQAELTQSLADVGFSVQHVFGDWDREPVDARSPELIFVATRE